MKKFLSILMLACLLALGMALPAAAEGGSLSTLYALAEDGTKYSTGMAVPTGIVREVKFYINGDDTEVEATPVVADSAIASVTKTDEGYKIQGLAEGETTVTMHDDNGAISNPFTIVVRQSALEVSIDGGKSWETAVRNKLSTDVSYPVMLRFGTNFSLEVDSGEVFIDCDPEDITIEPTSGLVLRDGVMIASKRGDYTLNYCGCTATVSIEYQGTNDITKDELEYLNKDKISQSEFINFLETEKGYCGKGDFTLQLPKTLKGSDSIECSNGLTDGTLTLKGAVSIANLKISAENIAVDDITLNSIQLHDVSQFEARKCTFSDVPYHIYTGSSGDAPRLILTENTYRATDFAKIYDDKNSLIGTWKVTGNKEAEGTAWDLGYYKWDTLDSPVQAFTFYVDASVNALAEKGWKFEFRHPSSFASAYSTWGSVAYPGEFEANSNPKTYVMSISECGNYAVISGPYPEISKKNEVVLKAVDVRYLYPIIVDTTFSNATVTHNSKQVDASINNKKLTFYPNEAGTYKVTPTTAATSSNKNPVQNRNYKYTYQDFYQVTPVGFTNAMRYVKDNLVTLNCTEAGTRSISLPVASMAAAAEKGYSVLVKTKNAELTLDAAALKSIAQQAKGTTVLLHYKSLNHKTLTTVGQASIQSHLAQFPGDNADLAFLVTATSDSETIEDLQMGTITLKIPFILLPGTEGMANTVYALQSESIAEARETTVADGHLTTKLLDLTEHMVFLTAEAAQPTEETTEATEETTESTEETIVETTQPETVPETTQPVEAEKQGGSLILTLVIGLGVVLVIGGGALGFLILRRRSRK